MASITINTKRYDPYKNFKFRVKWDGKYVLGVSKVGGLKRTTDVIEHREGGDPSTVIKSPGQTKYDPITLERGVTLDPQFEKWANKVWSFANAQANEATKEVSLKDFRKDIIIDVFNEAGQKVLSYNIYRCWVSEYQPITDLDANANAVAIQTLTLQNEGWVRDTSVTKPDEESFEDPTS